MCGLIREMPDFAQKSFGASCSEGLLCKTLLPRNKCLDWGVRASSEPSPNSIFILHRSAKTFAYAQIGCQIQHSIACLGMCKFIRQSPIIYGVPKWHFEFNQWKCLGKTSFPRYRLQKLNRFYYGLNFLGSSGQTETAHILSHQHCNSL